MLSKREKNTEAAVRRFSTKQVLLKISQNAQKNTYVGVSFLINVFKKRPQTSVSSKFCEIFQIFLYRTPPVLLKSESLFPDSLFGNSNFHLCIVVFTYLSSNTQNCSNYCFRELFSIFSKIFKTLLRLMIVKIFKESQTKTEANKSRNSRGVLKPCQNPVKHLRWSFLQTLLTAIHRQLFPQKASSEKFDMVLNTSLFFLYYKHRF